MKTLVENSFALSTKLLKNVLKKARQKEKDFQHIHFEGVALKSENGAKRYYISDYRGYVLYVTAIDENTKLAREKINKLMQYIYIPKIFYRNDIGANFIDNGYDKLHWWKYL